LFAVRLYTRGGRSCHPARRIFNHRRREPVAATAATWDAMSAERKYEPDWENSDTWNEYTWEEALKYSDHLAGRYFHMLDRFADLPDAEELIAIKLGRHEFFELEEGELYTFERDDDFDSFDDD